MKVKYIIIGALALVLSCKAIPNFPPQAKLQVGTNTILGDYTVAEKNKLNNVADFFVSKHFLIDILDDQEGILQTKFSPLDGSQISFQILIINQRSAKIKIYELKDNMAIPMSFPNHMVSWQIAKRITQILELKHVTFARY